MGARSLGGRVLRLVPPGPHLRHLLSAPLSLCCDRVTTSLLRCSVCEAKPDPAAEIVAAPGVVAWQPSPWDAAGHGRALVPPMPPPPRSGGIRAYEPRSAWAHAGAHRRPGRQSGSRARRRCGACSCTTVRRLNTLPATDDRARRILRRVLRPCSHRPRINGLRTTSPTSFLVDTVSRAGCGREHARQSRRGPSRPTPPASFQGYARRWPSRLIGDHSTSRQPIGGPRADVRCDASSTTRRLPSALGVDSCRGRRRPSCRRAPHRWPAGVEGDLVRRSAATATCP